MNIYCFSTLSFAKLQFKSVINKAFHKHGVASFTDAWIETMLAAGYDGAAAVASFTDAWIETPQQGIAPLVGLVASFTDAWIETYFRSREQYLKSVASFTDAWIETPSSCLKSKEYESHLLQMRGLKLALVLKSVKMPRRIFYRCVD